MLLYWEVCCYMFYYKTCHVQFIFGSSKVAVNLCVSKKWDRSRSSRQPESFALIDVLYETDISAIPLLFWCLRYVNVIQIRKFCWYFPIFWLIGCWTRFYLLLYCFDCALLCWQLTDDALRVFLLVAYGSWAVSDFSHFLQMAIFPLYRL